MPKPPTLDEAKAILARLKGREIGQKEISAATGIDQGHVSRLIRGDFKKVGGRALQLCRYVNEEAAPEPVQLAINEIEKQIVEQALSLWDGSSASGLRVINLLNAIRSIAGKA